LGYSGTQSYVWYNTSTSSWNNSSVLGSGDLYSTLPNSSPTEPLSSPFNQWETLSYQSSSIIGSTPQYPIETDGLILWLDAGSDLSWPGSGVNWNDITNNNNDSTFYQSLSATTPNYSPENGGSFTFNGSNQKFSIPSTSPTLSAITNTVSVEAWLRPTLFDDREIFSKSSNGGLRMRLDNSGHVWMLGGNGPGPVFDIYVSSGTTTLNEWNQVVGVWTSSGFYTYINGVNSGYDSSSSLLVQGNLSGLDIGCFTGNSPDTHYQGNISIFRVYNKVLTSDEVLSNFNSQKDRFGL